VSQAPRYLAHNCAVERAAGSRVKACYALGIGIRDEVVRLALNNDEMAKLFEEVQKEQNKESDKRERLIQTLLDRALVVCATSRHVKELNPSSPLVAFLVLFFLGVLKELCRLIISQTEVSGESG
jgi:hypothetical protein